MSILKLIKIYLITNDKAELINRLIKRNQDNSQIVEKRLNQYENDVQHWSDYDYVVVNNDLESCFFQPILFFLSINFPITICHVY